MLARDTFISLQEKNSITGSETNPRLSEAQMKGQRELRFCILVQEMTWQSLCDTEVPCKIQSCGFWGPDSPGLWLSVLRLLYLRHPEFSVPTLSDLTLC